MRIDYKKLEYLLYEYVDPFEVPGALKAVDEAEIKEREIGYTECAVAMMAMWINDVITAGEYRRIMDKLNAFWKERQNNET